MVRENKEDYDWWNYYSEQLYTSNQIYNQKITSSKLFIYVPDQTAAEVQAPARSCSSSWHDTDRMTEIGIQIRPPCPTTTDLEVAYSQLHAIQPASATRNSYSNNINSDINHHCTVLKKKLSCALV